MYQSHSHPSLHFHIPSNLRSTAQPCHYPLQYHIDTSSTRAHQGVPIEPTQLRAADLSFEKLEIRIAFSDVEDTLPVSPCSEWNVCQKLGQDPSEPYHDRS